MDQIKQILDNGTVKEKLALFQFNVSESNDKILLKFNLWSRKLFPNYHESPDAPFHDDINLYNLKVYKGEIDQFVNAAFRGAGKDVKTQLFVTFAILNDTSHFRKYFKVLSDDGTNAEQTVTDIYNMLVNPAVTKIYGNLFEASKFKREERMSSFTTATGIKCVADTVGTAQRGAKQEESRPDFLWFNDFETRTTLRSVTKTRTIRENMEEARTGLQKGGGCIYTCNYVSELGNVHDLIKTKLSDRKKVLIIPIIEGSKIMWDRYNMEDIEVMKKTDLDFEGERLCKPDSSKDIYFDREKLDEQVAIEPIKEVGGLKIFKEYNPGHRYAGGHDVAGGVGLDSSTSVFIDFDTIPARVVGTYHSNTILPEAFGNEIYNEANKFGGCLVAIENNKYDQAVLKAKLLGAKLFLTPGKQTKIGYATPTTYGWSTNSLTKNQMMSSLAEALEAGLIDLNDQELIDECKAYTRNDLIDREPDPRDTTRHFDLVIALAIAWQMRNYATKKPVSKYPGLGEKEEGNPAI